MCSQLLSRLDANAEEINQMLIDITSDKVTLTADLLHGCAVFPTAFHQPLVISGWYKCFLKFYYYTLYSCFYRLSLSITGCFEVQLDFFRDDFYAHWFSFLYNFLFVITFLMFFFQVSFFITDICYSNSFCWCVVIWNGLQIFSLVYSIF